MFIFAIKLVQSVPMNLHTPNPTVEFRHAGVGQEFIPVKSSGETFLAFPYSPSRRASRSSRRRSFQCRFFTLATEFPKGTEHEV